MTRIKKNNLCLVIDLQKISKSTTALKSFLHNNKWFKGTIILLTDKTIELNSNQVNTLNQIWDDIKIVEIEDTLRRPEDIRMQVFDIECDGLIYMSGSSLIISNIERCINDDHISTYGDNMTINTKLDKVNSNFMFIPKSFLTESIRNDIFKDDTLNIDERITKVLRKYNATFRQDIIITESRFYPNNKYGNFVRMSRMISIIVMNADGKDFRRINTFWVNLNNRYLMDKRKPSNVKVDRIINPPVNTNIDESKHSISIIIPAYRAESFIKECIDSILSQETPCRLEILIGVDNCKSTKKYLKSIDLPDNVRVFYSKQSVGPYVLRNSLIDEAKFDDILFFDADDVMFPNLISTVLMYKKDGRPLRFKYYNFNDGDDYKIKKSLHPSIAHGVFFVNKDVLSKLGGFKNWLCGADTEFMKRCNRNKITDVSINNPLFYRRIHNSSLTQNKSTNHRSKIREYAKKYIRENKDWSIPISKITTILKNI